MSSSCSSSSDSHHHHHHEVVFTGKDPGFRRALMIVILINALMFIVEITAGHVARSTSLMADALDFLGDSVTYTLSFIVIGMAPLVRARTAMIKGIVLFLMAVWVLGAAGVQIWTHTLPEAPVMGVVGFMALVTNVVSVALLYKYQNGDANIRSVWLCSRNDAIGNIMVLIAAVGVFGTGTAWPDLIVGVLMGALFAQSSIQIIRLSWAEMKKARRGHGHHDHPASEHPGAHHDHKDHA